VADTYQRYPQRAMVLEKGIGDYRTKLVTARKQELEADEQEMKNDVATMTRMVDPTAFTVLRQKLSPDAQQLVGETFDPVRITQLVQAGAKNATTTAEMRLALQNGDIRTHFLTALEHASTPDDVKDISEGLDEMYGPRQAAIFKQSIGDPLTPEGKARIQELKTQGQKPTGGTSDYAQFLSRWAAEKHQTTPDKPTASQELAARKAYGQADDAARRPLAPIVIQTAQGPMVTTGGDRTHVAPIIGADGKPVAPMPTSDQRNRQAGMGTAKAIMDSIDELSAKINTGQGAMAKISGEVEKAKAKANLNDDMSEYEALISGFTPLLARAVGHTGVLTEQDVQSVRKMLPQAGDSKSVRDRKMSRIRTIMDRMPGGSAAGTTQQAGPAPKRPAGVPPEAVWDAASRSWVIR
jgi:hypothetical protein